MALLEYRQRSGYLFLAVVIGHVLLISARVNSRSGVPMLEAVTVGIFSEVQRTVSGVVTGVRRGWNGYIGLRHVYEENEELKRQLAAAEIQIQEHRAQADRARGLESLLELRNRAGVRTTGAEIIGGPATPGFRTMTLNKGTRDGVATDLAVIAPAGVVGRIVVASGRSSKVQLLLDRNAAIGALIERTRAQGVVVGLGEDRLQMEYMSDVADVVVGDAVVSSGIDGIFPKGFAIGKVDAIERSGGGYRKISVRPAVDFTSLEEVLVVLDRPSSPREASDGVSE
jgi:rod shape-determining protein MreC